MKKSTLWILTAILLAVLIALAAVVISLSGRSDKVLNVSSEYQTVSTDAAASLRETGTEEESISVIESADIPEPDVSMIEIETPNGKLYFPGEWAALVAVEMAADDPDMVTFAAVPSEGKTQPLFSVIFNCPEAEAEAWFLPEGLDRRTVRFEEHDFDPDDSWTDSEIFIVQAMASTLQNVKAAMELEYTESAYVNPIPEDDGARLTVETPVADLEYPARWAEYISAEVDESTGAASFYANIGGHESLFLFAVSFDAGSGAYVRDFPDKEGTERGLYLNAGTLVFDELWSEDEKMIAYAMQEDLNVLLDAIG